MELKQLEFFLTACDCGSLNKAAARLFTSQPNVSKVIASLERELGYALFERTSKGLRMTEKGHAVHEYALHVQKSISIIEGLGQGGGGSTLSVSSYASNMIARTIADMCKANDRLIVRYQQGSVEEITDQVASGMTEVGILYIAQKQLHAFNHIISHKKLEFVVLDTKEACVYVGPNHPFYDRQSIDLAELHDLRFVQGTQEFFSMEHHLEHVELGAISTERLQYAAYTNSDHLTVDLLLNTDICSLGLDFLVEGYEQYDIKMLKIKNSHPFVAVGYVHDPDRVLSAAADLFLTHLSELLK